MNGHLVTLLLTQ